MELGQCSSYLATISQSESFCRKGGIPQVQAVIMDCTLLKILSINIASQKVGHILKFIHCKNVFSTYRFTIGFWLNYYFFNHGKITTEYFIWFMSGVWLLF
jgi:hypothetical protein